MKTDAVLEKFIDQFNTLENVVLLSEHRAITNDVDNLFYENQNVFTKAYLVSACSILEAFIQDMIYEYVQEMQNRILDANLPLNFVYWEAGHQKANFSFASFCGKKNKTDIADLVSANYWKTRSAFERVGLDLERSEAASFKDFVSSWVDRRNKIVHHNDQASEVSYQDILTVISEFRKYCRSLTILIDNCPHLSSTNAMR